MKKILLLMIAACASFCMQAQTNLLSNGGFETWTEGTPDNWKSASTASSADLSQSTEAHSGTYAVKVANATANKRLAYKEITLKAGNYTFSFYVKSSSSDVNASVRPGYTPISEEGKALTYQYGEYTNDITTEWQQVTHTFKLDAKTKLCLVVMNPKSTDKATYADFILDDAVLSTTDGGFDEGTGGDENDDNDETWSYTFTKVTKITTDKQYIIAANVDGVMKVAQNLSETKTYGYLNVDDAKEVDGKITLDSKNNVYTFKGSNIIDNFGRYLYQTGTYNSFNVAADAAEGIDWTITFNEDGTAKIMNDDVQKYFQFSTGYSSYGSYAEPQDGAVLPAIYMLTDSVSGKQEETPLSKIADVVAAETNGKYKVQGTIVAACASGALLSDGTGFIYYYNKANALVVGDQVTMEGNTTTYNGFKQFTDAATITKTGTTTVKYPEAVNINLDEWAATPVIEYVKMSGTLAISGNYYNVTVNGATAIGSLVYPTDAQKEQLADGEITVYGYAIYTSSQNRYVNIIVTSIGSEQQHEDETPLSKIGDVVAAQENGKFKVEGTVVAACASGALLGDGTGFIYYYNKANELAVGDQVTMEGATSTYNGFKQFTDAATITKTGTTTVEYPEAVDINLDEWAASPVIEYVKLCGNLTISGNYYNVAVDGATAIGSLVYPTDAQKEQLSDGPVTVFGYAIYTSSKNKYVNIIVTSIENANSIETLSESKKAASIFSINGVKLPMIQKGLNIVDGKKVLVK